LDRVKPVAEVVVVVVAVDVAVAVAEADPRTDRGRRSLLERSQDGLSRTWQRNQKRGISRPIPRQGNRVVVKGIGRTHKTGTIGDGDCDGDGNGDAGGGSAVMLVA
jgi:hypothetical protein